MTELGERRDCETFQALLDAFLEGTLPPEGEQCLRSHLEGCENCREELWALGLGRRARELLMPEPGYEQELVERRSRALEQLAAPRPVLDALHQFRRWWWVAASVAALALAVALIREFGAPKAVRSAPPREDVAELPPHHPREVTNVTFVHDDVKIVWVFDSQFEP